MKNFSKGWLTTSLGVIILIPLFISVFGINQNFMTSELSSYEEAILGVLSAILILCPQTLEGFLLELLKTILEKFKSK